MKKSIDINCDLGEGFGRFQVSDEAQIMPLISSCNIACGFHAGDPLTIKRTIDLAMEHSVNVGAHPGYPDLVGFGRRFMDMSPSELYASMVYQIGAVKALVEAAGGSLMHVKPHGALYNRSAKDLELAITICKSILDLDKKMVLVGLANSAHQQAAEQAGLSFRREAFIDRRYDQMGHLVSRKEEQATISKPELALEQLMEIIENHEVRSLSGESVEIQADTFCIHGDNPAAIDILKKINDELVKRGYTLGK